MCKLYFLLLALVFTFYLNAQDKKQLSLDMNRSFHGSGDMGGLGFAVEYGKYIRKRLEATVAIGSNIHHDEFKVLVLSGPTVINGEPRDVSYRMVTAGVQLNGQFNYAVVRTNKNEVRIGAGPLIRYQSSSASGAYSFYASAPGAFIFEPAFSFLNTEPQNMITAGYLVSFSYTFTFPAKLFISAKASFQNDTNADVITQYGLRIGRRF